MVPRQAIAFTGAELSRLPIRRTNRLKYRHLDKAGAGAVTGVPAGGGGSPWRDLDNIRSWPNHLIWLPLNERGFNGRNRVLVQRRIPALDHH